MHNTEQPNRVTEGKMCVVYPHTDACTPSGFLPQTPLLLPQFMLILESFAPADGLEAAEVDRSLALEDAAAFSFGAKP